MSTVSVCCAVYRVHEAPNVSSLAADLPAALGEAEGDLIVALNGISASKAGVPPGARTVELALNMGVSPGWNAAADAASGEILVFANDDVKLGPGSIAKMVEALGDHADAGVVGPAGAMWDIERGRHLQTVDGSDIEAGGVRECDAISGFLFAVRRAVFVEIGGFDEAYAPASFEEIDLCFAVRSKGLKALVVGGVDVSHEWGVSARQPPWRTVRWNGKREVLWAIHRRNRKRLHRKWSPG